MAISAWSAWWFLPFVLPLCFYVAFTDMREMRITNQSVIALVMVFLLVGLIALPFDQYLWRLAQLVSVLLVTIALNAAGVMGAGDSKFIAAAAPFVALGDVRFVIALYAANLLAAYATHRLAKHSPLQRVAPHWISWNQGKKFPMGFALGGTLAFYLGLGAVFGS
ncbi:MULTISPECIES: prepilin peptidase [Roseobacteraceae]|uniref:Type IV leader peptidase family protein n=1 Tax=Pseudosulfitobacter pseudonitzschiae TaxID=1402135 RepID=A0A221K2B6_9RHOB|nr:MULTISPECIES: prepilin peptidase [Roseobacteraceae]ASM72987.1 type IV leader peptidase family protein [Pseudosulfitobacter pseudonitzschiae]